MSRWSHRWYLVANYRGSTAGGTVVDADSHVEAATFLHRTAARLAEQGNGEQTRIRYTVTRSVDWKHR